MCLYCHCIPPALPPHPHTCTHTAVCAQGIADFTQRLPSQAHEEVRFLLYRLDFTEFYKRSAPADSDGEEQAGSGATPRQDGMLVD
eukprot:360469-Chlamydomonas_euryale.AAC.7